MNPRTRRLRRGRRSLRNFLTKWLAFEANPQVQGTDAFFRFWDRLEQRMGRRMYWLDRLELRL